MAEAFDRFAGVDLMATISARGETDRGELARAVAPPASASAHDDSWSDIFSRVIVERIEPALGIGRPAILYEYPIAEAALGAAEAGRSARRRAVRTLCLRRRAGELLRRTDRRRRAAPPLRGRHGGQQRLYGRALSDRRGFPRRPRHMPPASGAALGLRPAGDAGPPVRRGSTRCCGRRLPSRRRRAHRPSMAMNTLRSAAALADAGLLQRDRLPALAKVARALCGGDHPCPCRPDRSRRPSADPIARQFLPAEAELLTSAGEHADPIGDEAHSPVRASVHRYPDRVLLKATHTCAVYCRFCFRREMVGPGKAKALTPAQARRRAGLHQGRPRDLGGDPDRRRSADAVAAAAGGADGSTARIEHVKVVRYHTRIPVADPAVITPALVAAMKSPTQATYVALHATIPAN